MHLDVIAALDDSSELAKRYHLAKTIEYKITVSKSFDNLAFIFDAQSLERPSFIPREMVMICIQSAIKNKGIITTTGSDNLGVDKSTLLAQEGQTAVQCRGNF